MVSDRPNDDDRPTRRAVAGFIATLGVAPLATLGAVPAAAAGPTETFARSTRGSTRTVNHSAWESLLKAYLVPGPVTRMRYASFKGDAKARAALKAYIAALAGVDVASLDRPEQFAFWANLYNAKTIDIVLEAYPVASIKDIKLGGSLKALVSGGPWSAKVVTVGGSELALDDIEHAILRPIFKDPRVHYAVNCASVGCPSLPVEPFTGARLEAQLDAAARAFVNHERGIAVAGGTVTASSIYSWFQEDFGGSDAGVLTHARRFAEPALRQKLDGVTKIANFKYDWSLNEAK